MTSTYETAKSVWWLIHKDLIREVRARAMWPAMLMLGLLLVSILAMHIDLPKEQKEHLIGGLLWLAIVFAGTLALEWSFANEREDGCWKTLTLYPIAPSMLFLAKMLINVMSLVILELVLIPLFVVLTDVPLLAQSGSHRPRCRIGQHRLRGNWNARKCHYGRSQEPRRIARVVIPAARHARRAGQRRQRPA